jgi:hypothetical protein
LVRGPILALVGKSANAQHTQLWGVRVQLGVSAWNHLVREIVE